MNWTPVILQFLQTTLFVLIPGLVGGTALGLFFGWLFKLIYKAAPGLRPWFMLFPWRTIMLAAVVLSCTPMLFYLLGPDQAFSSTLASASTFLLLVFFIFMDLLLQHWLPIGLGVKITGLLRTLAVLGVSIVLVGTENASSMVGSDAVLPGLLRFTRLEVLKTYNLDSLWIMLGIVAGLGLVLDLIFGVVQMLFGLAGRKKPKKSTVEPVG